MNCPICGSSLWPVEDEKVYCMICNCEWVEDGSPEDDVTRYDEDGYGEAQV